MKQAWKCDFCSTTGTLEEIVVHETKCVFNPDKKLCWTCKFRYEGGMPISGNINECEKGLSCYKITDSKMPCSEWE